VAGQRRVIDRMLQLQPNFLGAHLLAASMDAEQRDCSKTRDEANFLAQNYPKMPITQSTLSFAAGCSNDKPETLRRIKLMITMKAQAWQVAIAFALIHDADHAIAQLNKSADAHEGQILYLKYNPFFDELRSDPRYLALERRVGLQ